MATNLSQTGLEVDKVEHGDIPTGGTDKVLLYASGSGSDTRLYVKSGANTQKQLGFDIDQFDALGGTGVDQADHFIFSDGGTEKKITFSNLEDAIFGNVSGDATIAAGGALTIANDAVEQAMIADDAVGADQLASNAVVNASIASNAAIDMDKLDGGSLASSLSDLAQGDLLYAGDVDDSNNLKSITFSNLEDAIFGNVSGDATIAAGGALTIAAQAVENSMLADDAVGADELAANAVVNASVVDGSLKADKLDLDGSTDIGADLVDADLMIVDDGAGGTNRVSALSRVKKYIYSAMSGDATASDSGALTIANAAVEHAMLANDAVDGDNIADDSVNSEHIALGALDAEHYASGSIQGGHVAQGALGAENYATGSVQNAHLAGSIANAKLANSSVTLTQGAGMASLGAVSLGGSVTIAVDGVLEDLDTLGAASADGEFIVATGAGAFAYESGNTARTSLGLGTGDSPSFTGVTVSGLTAGRIPFAGTGGALSDEANLQYIAAANSLKLDGHLSGSGNMQFDGNVITGGNHNISGSALIGPGGYSGTGVTITSGGNISGKGNLTVAGTAQFAGGYGNGDGGVDISSTGGLNMDGNFRSKGNFEVGTAGASGNSAKFHGDSANHFMQYDADKLVFSTDNGSSNAIEIGTETTNGFAIEVGNLSGDAGKIKATAFVTYSDESLKEEVTAMDNALNAVMSLNGVEFTWKNSGERDFGFLAQEVKNVLPKAVSVGNDGIHGVDYSRLTSVLVEAVKAQQVQIEELKAILKK